jgi:hypothetical protein
MEAVEIIALLVVAVFGYLISYGAYAVLVRWPRLLALRMVNNSHSYERYHSLRWSFLVAEFVLLGAVGAVTCAFPILLSFLPLSRLDVGFVALNNSKSLLMILLYVFAAVVVLGVLNDFLAPRVFGGRSVINPPGLYIRERVLSERGLLNQRLTADDRGKETKSFHDEAIDSLLFTAIFQIPIAFVVTLVVASHVVGLAVLLFGIIIVAALNEVDPPRVKAVLERMKTTNDSRSTVSLLKMIGGLESIDTSHAMLLVDLLGSADQTVSQAAQGILSQFLWRRHRPGSSDTYPTKILEGLSSDREKWGKWVKENWWNREVFRVDPEKVIEDERILQTQIAEQFSKRLSGREEREREEE